MTVRIAKPNVEKKRGLKSNLPTVALNGACCLYAATATVAAIVAAAFDACYGKSAPNLLLTPLTWDLCTSPNLYFFNI